MHIQRFEYIASQQAMASPHALETPVLLERTPSPLPLSSPMSDEEDAIDDDMSISAAAQAADNLLSAAASSKSEEILANVKNLSLYDEATTSVKDKVPYDVHVEFFDFDALPAVEPSLAVPHIRIGSEYEDPIYSQSVDPMDDHKDEHSSQVNDNPNSAEASSPSQPGVQQAATAYADLAPAAAGR